MPVTCGRNGLGICHPDLWIIASFAIAFGALHIIFVIEIGFMIKHRLRFGKFMKSEHTYFTQASLYGLEKWESRHAHTDKHGHTTYSYVTRYRARLQYTDAKGADHRVDFSSKDERKVHEGGVSYDEHLAAKPFKEGGRGSGMTTATLSIPVIVDVRQPHCFVVGGVGASHCLKMWMCFGAPLGLGFAVTAAVIKMLKGGPNGDQSALDHSAIDFGARDAALEIPGVGGWKLNFVDTYDGTNWAAFYTDTGETLAVPLLLLACIFYIGSILAAVILDKSKFKAMEPVQKQVEKGSSSSGGQAPQALGAAHDDITISVGTPSWEYQDSGDPSGMFKPYDNDCQQYIEKIYQEFKSGEKGPRRTVKTGGQQIQIDFNTMQDSYQRQVRRN
eukprot:gnl/MRDRNA2_/MRDRNA2_110444_c0_seq1.p1 gnl/MRDRNA2_/MRDRNA2_110444_c0~~gnl/MRDRNA2_/MRDRNA2_110444_c0_seq1.p1  ORF type:complete len:455 (-),score=79.45 gnl/MRDRNA2_/MRDRNA2_110444_c0_seq1:166-1329(-)